MWSLEIPLGRLYNGGIRRSPLIFRKQRREF
jgi:hypothetical protein